MINKKRQCSKCERYFILSSDHENYNTEPYTCSNCAETARKTLEKTAMENAPIINITGINSNIDGRPFRSGPLSTMFQKLRTHFEVKKTPNISYELRKKAEKNEQDILARQDIDYAAKNLMDLLFVHVAPPVVASMIKAINITVELAKLNLKKED